MNCFDPKCYDLAEYFLPTTASPALKDDLAQYIQDAVEDWLRIEDAALGAEGERKTQ